MNRHLAAFLVALGNSLTVFATVSLAEDSTPNPVPPAASQPAPATNYVKFHVAPTAAPFANKNAWSSAWDAILPPIVRTTVGDTTTISIIGPGLATIKATCWRQGKDTGSEVDLTPTPIILGSDGTGSFVFPAKEFPRGPATVRVAGFRAGSGDPTDTCFIELFNTAGTNPANIQAATVSGIPDSAIPSGKPINVGFIPNDDIVGKNSSEQVAGFMVDVLNALLTSKGYDVTKVVYHETSKEAFSAGLDSGQYDLCIAGVSRTPQVEQRVDFLDPLFSLGGGALVGSDNGHIWNVNTLDDVDGPFTARGILSAKDVDGPMNGHGFTVLVVQGEYAQEYAAQHFKNALIVVEPDPQSVCKHLIHTHDLIGLTDQYTLSKYHLRHPNNDRDRFAPVSLGGTGHPYNVLPICWSVRKGNTAAAQFWNAGLHELKSNGTIDAIKREYEHYIPFLP